MIKQTILTLMISALPLGAADPLWRIDFNSEGEGAAPRALLMAGAGETSVSGPFEQSTDAEADRMRIVPSDGPDGGMALELRSGETQNGAGYLSVHRNGKLEGNTFTYEALIQPSENTESFNKRWGGQQILNQQPGGSLPQFWFAYDGEGTVQFGTTAKAHLSGPVTPGAWSHLAGVVTLSEEEGGECRMKFYINGEPIGEETFVRPPGQPPASLGLGRYLQSSKGDSFQGRIDAVAVTPAALAPGGFTLPLPR